MMVFRFSIPSPMFDSSVSAVLAAVLLLAALSPPPPPSSSAPPPSPSSSPRRASSAALPPPSPPSSLATSDLFRFANTRKDERWTSSTLYEYIFTDASMAQLAFAKFTRPPSFLDFIFLAAARRCSSLGPPIPIGLIIPPESSLLLPPPPPPPPPPPSSSMNLSMFSMRRNPQLLFALILFSAFICIARR
jgi:hypothetical protein